MAKVSAIAKNNRRKRIVSSQSSKRDALKAIIMNKDLPFAERFEAQLKLQKLPRDTSKIRIRNRCGLTGRPRGYYRKFNISRIALRELSNYGKIPGVVKSSW